MKRSQTKSLVAQLNRIKADLGAIAGPESKAAFSRNLDEIIARLNTIRSQLANPPLEARLSEIERPLEQVIDFLEFAKDDEVLAVLLSGVLDIDNSRAKRTPIEIPDGLKNDQIRSLLAQNLSKQELKAIAAQRGISVGKSGDEDVKREILRVLDRQEGYERLASPLGSPGSRGRAG
jgi:hypothetical protein